MRFQTLWLITRSNPYHVSSTFPESRGHMEPQYRYTPDDLAIRPICIGWHFHNETWGSGIGFLSMAVCSISFLWSTRVLKEHYLQSPFFFRPIINTSCNDIPSTIHISDIPSPERASCCYSKLRFKEKSQWTIHRSAIIRILITMIGATGTNKSYNLRASLILHDWNVSCKQLHPIPKPIASI